MFHVKQSKGGMRMYLTVKKFIRKQRKDIEKTDVLWIYTYNRTVYHNTYNNYILDVKRPLYAGLPHLRVRGWYVDGNTHFIFVSYF